MARAHCRRLLPPILLASDAYRMVAAAASPSLSAVSTGPASASDRRSGWAAGWHVITLLVVGLPGHAARDGHPRHRRARPPGRASARRSHPRAAVLQLLHRAVEHPRGVVRSVAALSRDGRQGGAAPEALMGISVTGVVFASRCGRSSIRAGLGVDERRLPPPRRCSRSPDGCCSGRVRVSTGQHCCGRLPGRWPGSRTRSSTAHLLDWYPYPFIDAGELGYPATCSTPRSSRS